MSGKLHFVLVALMASVLAGCDWEEFGESARVKDDFHYTYPLKAGGRVSVENFNGSVEIVSWNQDSVEIAGTKYAPTREILNALRIDVVASADAVRIRTVRPTERQGNIGARMTIRVPKKAELDRVVSSNGSVHLEDLEGAARVRTSNGSLRLMRVAGPIDAQTSNGSVEVREASGGVTLRTSNGSIVADGVRGYFEATTSNGSITARLAEAQSNRTTKLESSNGRIELTLDSPKFGDVRASTTNSSIIVRMPAAVGARVAARTSHSPIQSDFAVTNGEASKNTLDGTIGAGGPLLDLSTSNGSIKLLKL